MMLVRSGTVKYRIVMWASVVAAVTLPTVSQTDDPHVCLAQGATIYSPAEDHIKTPKFQIVQGLEKPMKVSSPAVFDVLINPRGRICDIHVIKAPDRETARQLGHYIGDYFRFNPATREGKPVAARVRVVFDTQGKVSTAE